MTPKFESLKAFERAARVAAGLPEYDMDDPERPFTEEYDDNPMDELQADEPNGVDFIPEDDAGAEDTTPSADARALHAAVEPEELRAIRLRHVREIGIIPSRHALQEGIERAEAKDRHPTSRGRVE